MEALSTGKAVTPLGVDHCLNASLCCYFFFPTSAFSVLIILFDNSIWLADGKILPVCLVPDQAVSCIVGLYLIFSSDFCFSFHISYEFTLSI